MAIVFLGGVATSTLIHLTVVPALYLAFGAATREPDLLADAEPVRSPALDVEGGLAT
jgi:hypothetical protein